MAKDIFYEQEFKCKCKKRIKQYVWQSEVNDQVCAECQQPMKPIYVVIPETPGVIMKSVHRNGRTLAEREKRRSDDFKKNTLPTLGGQEKRYFEKKFKKK